MAMDGCTMANDHIVPDGAGMRSRMNHTVVFNNGILTNGYFAKVSSNDCPRPRAGIFSDFHISDNISGFTDKG